MLHEVFCRADVVRDIVPGMFPSYSQGIGVIRRRGGGRVAALRVAPGAWLTRIISCI
jgi:hypothetical protein